MHEFIAVNARSDGILQCKTETEKKSSGSSTVLLQTAITTSSGVSEVITHTVTDYKYRILTRMLDILQTTQRFFHKPNNVMIRQARMFANVQKRPTCLINIV